MRLPEHDGNVRHNLGNDARRSLVSAKPLNAIEGNVMYLGLRGDELGVCGAVLDVGGNSDPKTVGFSALFVSSPLLFNLKLQKLRRLSFVRE